MNIHVDVGAYLLGALDDAEMDAFEEHLAGCEVCAAELDRLSGLLPLLEEFRTDAAAGGTAVGGRGGGTAGATLGGAALAGPPSGDALLERLLARVAAERRTRGRRRLAAVAAAAVLVVGGPAVAVLATRDGGSPAAGPTAVAAPRHSASDRATGASAVVGVTDKGWGSAVDLRLTGVRGPLTCSLIAYGRDGDSETVATWSVPEGGYGTDAHPVPLTVHGAAGLHRDAISRFEVRTDTGALLVTVPT